MSEPKPQHPRPVSRLRLALALVVAPLILAAFLTLLAYLAAAAGEPTRADTMARTTDAARTFFLYLPLFSLTAGLAGALALLRLGLRGRIAWAGTGALLGAGAAAALGLISPSGPMTTHILVIAVLGFLMMSLVRGIAGITPAAAPPARPDDARR